VNELKHNDSRKMFNAGKLLRSREREKVAGGRMRVVGEKSFNREPRQTREHKFKYAEG